MLRIWTLDFSPVVGFADMGYGPYLLCGAVTGRSVMSNIKHAVVFSIVTQCGIATQKAVTMNARACCPSRSNEGFDDDQGLSMLEILV